MSADDDDGLTRDDERRTVGARYRTLFEHAPDGILIGDPQSNYLDANPSMCRMLGYERHELIGLNATDIIAVSQSPRIAPVIEDIKSRHNHHQEWEFRRKDGSVFPVEVIATLLPDGNLLGMVRDITERKATEAAMRSMHRAMAMLGACNDALIRAEKEEALLQSICRIVVEKGGYRIAAVGYAVNDTERSILLKAYAGETPENLRDIPRSWAADRPEGAGPAGRAIRSGKAVVVDDLFQDEGLSQVASAARSAGIVRGVYLPLRLSGRPFGVLALYSSEGVGTGASELKLLQELADNLAFGIGGIRQRVERERAEEALRDSLGEKQALLKEVHHRVKNNMQVITSLLRLEANRIDHETTRGVLKHMQNRIQSMAVLHETLYRSGNFTGVDLGAYLRLVSGQLMRSLALTPGQIELHLDLVSRGVDLDQAIPCGLIVNELVSNAFKHGFPKGRTGEVWIDLVPKGDAALILRVRDNGVGLPDDLQGARDKSLGLQLVSDLTRQLRGSLVIGPGSSFEVTFATEPGTPS